MNFVVFISELAMLNLYVKVVSEVMVSNLKHTQNNMQQKSKANGDKPSEANNLNGKIRHVYPHGYLYDSEAAERIHCYT